MNIILNSISVAAAFIFGVGIIYILLDTTIGRLRVLNSNFEWYGLQIKDFAFLAIGTLTILSSVSFVTPY